MSGAVTADRNTIPGVAADNRRRLEVLIVAAQLADGGPEGYGEWAYREWARHNEAYFGGGLLVGGIGWGLTRYGEHLGHYEPWRNFIILHSSLVDPRSDDPWGMAFRNARAKVEAENPEWLKSFVTIMHGGSEGDRARIFSELSVRTPLGKRFASDVILHEMIHQAIHQLRGRDHRKWPGGYHNSPKWVDEINRVSVLVGLPARAAVVKQRRVNGKPKWIPRDGFMTITEMGHWPHDLRPADYYLESERNTVLGVTVGGLA